MPSILPAIIFVAIVCSIFVCAAVIVARLFISRFRHRPASSPKKISLVDWIILGAAGIGLGCLCYGYFIEPYWPSVTHVQIKSSKLPAGAAPVRIVQISDLHSDPKPRLEDLLPGLIAKQKPDVIVFTGDSINSRDGLSVFKKCLTSIAQIAPTFVVKGNWDADFWRRVDLFGGTGAKELDGSSTELNVEGSKIWIGGVGVGEEEKIPNTLASMPSDAFTIFLYHYPDLIFQMADRHVDLYCAGHTHGGQVALPFYGALITLSKFGKRFESGLYQVDQTRLYVNRGIGMDGGRAPRVRFCARPEVTVIDIVPDSAFK